MKFKRYNGTEIDLATKDDLDKLNIIGISVGNVTLMSHWQANGASPHLIKIGNVVFLDGIVRNGNVAVNTIVANIEIDFRPKYLFLSIANSPVDNNTISIDTNGDIKILTQFSANQNYHLHAMWMI